MDYIERIINRHKEEIKSIKESTSCKGDFARKLLEKGLIVYFADGLKIYEKV